MSNESMTQRTIEFPKINWDELKKGALPKGKVESEIEKMLKCLIEVQMLKATEYLAKETLDKAREVDQTLEQLKEQYPQLIGVTQNILGRKIKELASNPGDSKTLFGRLKTLVFEAQAQGSLQEWEEADLNRVPAGLIKSFLVKLYDPRTKKARFFLPKNWRHPVHKRTALVLHDLSFKARDAYRTERGIQTPAETSKPEIPAKTQKPKSQPKPKTPKKSTKKDEADVKAAKRTKAVKVEDKGKEAEKEIRDAKKISLTDDPNALNFLKK